jgi:hypothetical protein
MNIFVLDESPMVAATYHCDRHVVKMVLETAQILCSAASLNGSRNTPYKPTHLKHPCVLWAAETRGNYRWLVSLGLELGNEYYRRYGKVHKSHEVIRQMARDDGFLPNKPRTDWAQCMPDECRIAGDAVRAYRKYYATHKLPILEYSWTDAPSWLTQRIRREHGATEVARLLGRP